jgi:urease accessory protein
MKALISRLTFIGLLFLPSTAFAHTGIGETTGLIHGLGHPLAGADHLLAMIAVGIWAAQIGGRALWTVPCTFVSVMVLGGMLGFFGVPVPFIEETILISVLILGILIATALTLPLTYSALIVGFFAIFHGHAHGAEMPVAMAAASYTVGFALVTAALHLIGMALGLLLQRRELQMVNRFAGGVIAVSGLYLAVA